MMTTERRTLLATLLAASALGGSPADAAPPLSPEQLGSLFGAGLQGEEQIAMLLYPGFTALDLVGPYTFLAMMRGARVHLVTNQESLAPVASDLGLAIQPTTTLKDCPPDIDILFAPGGTAGTIVAARHAPTLAFLAERGPKARFTTSVCTGSLILGAAGLLKGKRATSHWTVVPNLAQFEAIPVRARVVRDGQVITGAGVSAGIDFGAQLVAELRGARWAELTTLVTEYAPEPPFRSGSVDTASPQIADAALTLFDGFVRAAGGLKPI
jgi:cyclohexyl-isocyanide hydratase